MYAFCLFIRLVEKIKFLSFLEKVTVWDSNYAFSITFEKLLKLIFISYIFIAAIYQLLWQNML